MELQKSVGEMNATMQSMKSSLDGVKTKVDDLVGWKHKILGAAAALAVVFGGLGWLLGKASDYVAIKPSVANSLLTPSQPAAPPAQNSVPAPRR